MGTTENKATGLLEAAVYADDLNAAEVFYNQLLGFPNIQRVGERHVFFRVGDGVLLVFNPDETAKPSANPALPVPPHGSHGPGHVCFAMDRTNIDALHRRLISQNVSIDTVIDWPNGARSLYLRDPAGNSVEFAEPRLWQT